ncbi:MAG: VanZ family protein [Bacteroidales bacterium]|nr:VanZ family protein [Bacteroidales bacterium]
MASIKSGKYIVSILFAIVIFILSVWPADTAPTPSFFFKGMDKVIHGIMYGVFIVLILREYLKNSVVNYQGVIYLLLLTWIYSIIMELIQYFVVETRSGEIYDVLANMGGIIIGTAIFLTFKKVRS